MTWTIFLQQMINGISLGSLYGLVAIGYTMVYGILRLINFAHGDLLMVAAYAAILGSVTFSLPWFVSFPLAVLATGLMGILLDRAAYKPLRNAPRDFASHFRHRRILSPGKSRFGDYRRCAEGFRAAGSLR